MCPSPGAGLLAVLGGASNTRVQGVGSHPGVGAGIWGPPCTSRSSDPRSTPRGSGIGIWQHRPQTPTPTQNSSLAALGVTHTLPWQSGLSLGALFFLSFHLVTMLPATLGVLRGILILKAEMK